jgi:hypothetical protein
MHIRDLSSAADRIDNRTQRVAAAAESVADDMATIRHVALVMLVVITLTAAWVVARG